MGVIERHFKMFQLVLKAHIENIRQTTITQGVKRKPKHETYGNRRKTETFPFPFNTNYKLIPMEENEKKLKGKFF